MMGVYKITNIHNNKIYIGSSSCIDKRWKQHLDNLVYNIHENYKLQEDFNKFGLASFQFSVVELVKNKKDLLHREQEWIDSINVEDNYNIMSYSSYEYVERIKDNYDILNFEVSAEDKALIKQNINVCQHVKLNSIGDKSNDLSKSWYSKVSKDKCLQLGKNIYNFHHNISKGNDFYWTTFISYQKCVIGNSKGCIKNFISLTDIPKEKGNNLAYLVNNYSNPILKRKININDDEYALKVLLHWIINVSHIWKPINLYLPSSRMRKLLNDWITLP